MRQRPYRLLSALLLLSLLSLPAAGAENKFRLRPGAEGKICLTCHTTFQDKLKNPFVHTPVKAGNCIGCHSPHTSAHGKFLAADTNRICVKCHATRIPEKAVSVHKPVAEGSCVKCHDPHGAPNKSNLLRPGNAVCLECHKELGERAAAAKFKHNPVEKGCVNCHDPHASTVSERLLKDKVPSLCLRCHDTTKLIFRKQHMDYPVAEARCTMCHNPHGSDRKSLLYDQVHSPFAKKMCNQCHAGPSSASPLQLQKKGFELCKGCHSSMINTTFSNNRVHWALLDQTGCLNCHTPHTSDQPALLKKPMTATCGQCHKDTVERIKSAQSKHPPVQEGMCTVCHSPHASEQLYLLNQPSVIEVCKTCHDFQKHSAHPLGPNVVDPRNRNVRVACTSCHRAHGNEYKKMLHFPTSTELCTNCHTQLKR